MVYVGHFAALQKPQKFESFNLQEFSRLLYLLSYCINAHTIVVGGLLTFISTRDLDPRLQKYRLRPIELSSLHRLSSYPQLSTRDLNSQSMTRNIALMHNGGGGGGGRGDTLLKETFVLYFI